MEIGKIVQIVIISIALLYLVFAMIKLFSDKKVSIGNKITLIAVSILLSIRNIWLVIQSLL